MGSHELESKMPSPPAGWGRTLFWGAGYGAVAGLVSIFVPSLGFPYAAPIGLVFGLLGGAVLGLVLAVVVRLIFERTPSVAKAVGRVSAVGIFGVLGVVAWLPVLLNPDGILEAFLPAAVAVALAGGWAATGILGRHLPVEDRDAMILGEYGLCVPLRWSVIAAVSAVLALVLQIQLR